MQLLHPTNPFLGFPAADYELDLQGWDSQSPMFEWIISRYRPARIIEVGSWKGASAIHMAALVRARGIVAEILCVDTWLGGVHTWTERYGANFIPMRYGRPLVYEQFLANVIHSGHTGTIVPFPVDSVTGAMFATRMELQADAIYLDAGHDYEHVWSDITGWWPIVRPGGVMFGDDYHPHWHGLISAVNKFADANKVMVRKTFEHKWVIEKPAQ